jgi:patatin-like phospholipase/acyl hydrolase
MKRILSIDGGGIKGVVPAAFLAQLEESLGESITHYFDLIAGTSTGGILALGLGLGLSAADILHFYEQLGPAIFAGNQIGRGLRRIGFAKYHAQPLRQTLEATFGEKTLGESRTRLVIPSLNLETGEVHLHKTAHHPRFEVDYKERAVEVALATAAAPTYFPTYRSAKGIPLIDGGVWANNPIGLAVVEAVGVLDWQRDAIWILSLGCVTEPLHVGLARTLPLGLGYWAMKITDVFLTAQSFASLGTAYVLIGHEHVMRISPSISRGRFRLDSVKEIPSLRGLGASEARKALPRVRELFCQTHVEPFVPFKAP